MEAESDDECLGCKSERGCEGACFECKLIDLGLCARWAFNMRCASIIVLDLRYYRISRVSPVTRDVQDIVIWGFDIIDLG